MFCLPGYAFTAHFKKGIIIMINYQTLFFKFQENKYTIFVMVNTKYINSYSVAVAGKFVAYNTKLCEFL